MSNRYKRRGKHILKKDQIERKCLTCGKSFIADGKFNRICPTCTLTNAWLDQGAVRSTTYHGGGVLEV